MVKRETPLVITIVGDADAGKSVYLTMLIDALGSNEDFMSRLTYIGDDSVAETFYTHYQHPLSERRLPTHSAERVPIPPLPYHYWYQYMTEDGQTAENTIGIVFLIVDSKDLRKGFDLPDSSGVIFLADPLQPPSLMDLFPASPFQEDAAAKHAAPFALALSKADVFRYTDFNFFDNKPENRIQHLLPDENHRGALHMRCAKGVDFEVRELLRHMGEGQMVHHAAAYFASVACFAVSALGQKPRYDGEVAYLESPPMPFRIKEPFYWILMKNRLLNQYENGRYRPCGNGVNEQNGADDTIDTTDTTDTTDTIDITDTTTSAGVGVGANIKAGIDAGGGANAGSGAGVKVGGNAGKNASENIGENADENVSLNTDKKAGENASQNIGKKTGKSAGENARENTGKNADENTDMYTETVKPAFKFKWLHKRKNNTDKPEEQDLSE